MTSLRGMAEQIFDRRLLAQRRARHANLADAHDFLLQRANEEICARLDVINRDFALALNLGAYHGPLSAMLQQNPRIRRVVSADACLALLMACGGARVVCDEEILPFADGSFDLVISSLSLHMVNDLPGTLVQIRRALKPDGLFLAAVLGGGTLNELRTAFAVAEDEVDGGVSPRVAPFADVRDYGGLLQRAGFALPVTDSDIVQVSYETPLGLMNELRAMGASNTLIERRRAPMKRGLLLRAAELYTERFPAENERVAATFEMVYLTGWAPDASQPKPLRPGSAKTRLADALNTEELSAGERAGRPRRPTKD